MPKKVKKVVHEPAAPKRLGPPNKAAEALERVRKEAEALREDELATINMDIPVAVSTALGALANVRAMREEVVTELPKHPIESIDRLDTYAYAAWYAHLLALPASTSPAIVKTLEDEATPLREDLLGDAESLARRKKLDAKTVAEIRAGSGQVDKANDLVALAALFTHKWADIHDKTTATEAEIQRAAELGPLLLAALGVREVGAATAPNEAADLRKRAFTLFVNAYDQCRRAAAYLRWDEGDADELVPSLWKGRGGRPAPKAPAAPAEGGGTPA